MELKYGGKARLLKRADDVKSAEGLISAMGRDFADRPCEEPSPVGDSTVRFLSAGSLVLVFEAVPRLSPLL